MTSTLHFSGKDHSKEGTGFTLTTPNITALNIATWTDTGTGIIDELRAAFAAVLLGGLMKSTLIAQTKVHATQIPVSVWAQRENKALLRYHDSVTGGNFTIQLPMPDNTKLNADGSTYDLTDPDWAALVTVLEENILTPDGNLMVVDEVVYVGRNI